MAVESGVWGIDLGQCALKALRLENVDGQVTATAFFPKPRVVQFGLRMQF